MNRLAFTMLVATLALALTPGCRVRVRGTLPTAQVTIRTPAPPPPPSGSITVQMGGGVSIVDNYCSAGAAETCNGLDDNCNGVIDEGCGYSTGNVQITLAWATGADLDMYVTDPSGFTISYQNTQAPSGGHLDHDARGACVRTQADSTVENVYWNTPQPPSGRYQVEVHYYGDCNVAGPTQATLSIAVGGVIIGAYQVVLNARERQAVAYFDMP